MSDPRLTLSEEAHQTLASLAAASIGDGVPRLMELQAAALTLARPEDDDVVLRERDGYPLLAVSRRLLERLGGEAELLVDLSDVGEPSFRLVRKKT